jgi:hypothetical protein
MASIYSATTEGENALAAATAEVVLWLMGATTVRPRVVEWGVSFDGVSATAEPVQVKIFRTTSAGTTPTATVEKPWDLAQPAAQAIAAKGFGTPPSLETTPLAHYEVHPQAGIVIQYPLGREIVIDDATTDGFALECTAPAVVNASAYVVWEE